MNNELAVDLFYRTEDIPPDDVLDYFVESRHDRGVIDALKNRNPTILVGSRGVGKSFLLRVAQKEMADTFGETRIFPVYMSFVKSSLLQSSDPHQFTHWMLARICSTVLRALIQNGVMPSIPLSARVLTGGEGADPAAETRLEALALEYENSWKQSSQKIDSSIVPTVDSLKEALEDLTRELEIKRFSLLIDEAAHIFVPEQQRQFFTLFRDLRSHCITCNAAVYPGVTSFGATFQPAHDATMISIDRDILSDDYVGSMREIVEKQADSSILSNIARNGKNFSVLAYAASGNPRLLLKTLSGAPKVSSAQVNEKIREYYRTDIWAEHSLLADKYIGHREVIDWGRSFVEQQVLPQIAKRNNQALEADRKTSAYLWIHRDAPSIVKEALRVLSYTGVLSEQSGGIKATRAEVGTRYMVNLGCLFSLETSPSSTGFEIAKGLTPRRMMEFGANHPAYKTISDDDALGVEAANSSAFHHQLLKSVDVLDITDWQRSKLIGLNLTTVGDVLGASEAKLKEATGIGDVRARRMRNAAVAAVLEYLSG